MKEKTKKWTKERIIGLLLSIMEIGFLTFLLIFVISKGVWYWLGLVAILIIVVFILYRNSKIRKWTKGNGVIFGNRGSGKGLILNYLIRKDKTKPYSNVPYGDKTENINVGEYFNVLYPNTLDSFINNDITIIDKTPYLKYEKRNIYLDDVNIYFPNWADNKLKKEYPCMAVLLSISRHLFDNNMVITTQSADRPYKILRELQTDYGIQCKYSVWFNKYIPFLRHFVFTKYIYYENIENKGKLPFEGSNILGETGKGVYLTAGTATKKQYEAMNGKIRNGYLLQLKKKVNYDTRYFHEKVFGEKPPLE